MQRLACMDVGEGREQKAVALPGISLVALAGVGRCNSVMRVVLVREGASCAS